MLALWIKSIKTPNRARRLILCKMITQHLKTWLEHNMPTFSWINIISASLTSAGIISIVFVDQFWIKLVSAIVSFVTTTMSALLATFDYKNLAKSNKTAATKLVCYRNELLSMLGRIRIKEKTAKELFDEFENLQSSIHEAYQDAPNTTNRAVAKAGKTINESKDGTYSDEEIDRLLPDTLKRRNIK